MRFSASYPTALPFTIVWLPDASYVVPPGPLIWFWALNAVGVLPANGMEFVPLPALEPYFHIDRS